MNTESIVPATVLDRLLTGAGLKRDAQLAALLGVSPQAVSQARKKGRVPEGWIVRLADRYELSMEWLLHGTEGAVSQPAPLHSRQQEHRMRADSALYPHAPHPASGIDERAQPTGTMLQTNTADAPAAVQSALPPFAGTRRIIHQSVAEPAAGSEHSDHDDTPPLELGLIPLVSANLSAGGGSLEAEGEVLDHFAFQLPWLCRKGNPDNMVLMKVHGDSMEPDICHGDMVLIDQGKKHILGHTIYAVGVNEEIYIKQVETLPGNRMVLRSLNARYNPIEIDLRGDMADSVRIIGKVIWWCREA